MNCKCPVCENNIVIDDIGVKNYKFDVLCNSCGFFVSAKLIPINLHSEVPDTDTEKEHIVKIALDTFIRHNIHITKRSYAKKKSVMPMI